VKRLILVALFLEVGFLLVVIPWSSFWDRNYFAQSIPAVNALITNNFVRGAVSGLGLINVYLGLSELVSTLSARHLEQPPSSTLGVSRFSPKD
jgi:hypothetical protein